MFAAALSDPQVIATFITVVVGGLLGVITTLINRKANAAKDAVTGTSGEVQILKDVVDGLKTQTSEQRAEIVRKDAEIAHQADEITRLRADVDRLTKDLIEEKATTVALGKLKGVADDPRDAT